MTNIAKWEAPSSFTSIITTGLNSLANAGVATSSTQDNSSDLAMYADISVLLGSFNPSGNPYIEIHLLPRLSDGSSIADRNASTLIGSIAIDTGSNTKEAMLRRVELPPGHYQVAVVNSTGTTFAASGNTVAIRTYGENLNG